MQHGLVNLSKLTYMLFHALIHFTRWTLQQYTLSGIFKNMIYTLLQQKKCPKQKRPRGRRWPLFLYHEEARGQKHGRSYEKRPKHFSSGQDTQANRDLTCFIIKWPCSIQLQQQRTFICKQLKVLPAFRPAHPDPGLSHSHHLLKLAQKCRAGETKLKEKLRLPAVLSKKLQAKGTSPLRGYLSVKQESKWSQQPR